MTVNPYPAYRASGTAWLGDVPSEWAVQRLKNGFDLMKRPVLAADGNVTAFRDGQVTLRSNRRIDGFTEADKEIGYQGIEPKDLVIHAMDAFAGAIGVSDSRGKSTPVYSVCRARAGYDPRYYALTLRHIALSGYIASLGKGVRERSTDFRWTDAKSVLVPVPSVEEQEAILSYLDTHTAKIDTLIGKQERLIETLTERRQAVISHAVTKGLDPNVPMKDSGYEWVGRVPELWSIKRISWLFSLVGSGTTPPSDEERYYGMGTPWVTTGELREGTITETAKSVTQAATSNFPTLRVYEPGTLLIAMYGATIGRLAVLGVPACTNQACCAMSMPVDVLTRFAFYSLLAAREHILVLAVGGGQPNINQEMLRALRLPTPPMSEQEAIVEFLDRETNQIDVLSAKAGEMIDVLKERRQALISAAVTGKIDVRGLV